METTSLKSLAVMVLTGNPEGNSQETKSFLGGKQKGDQETCIETKAKGFGCVTCGNKIYHAIEAWETYELPEPSPWTHEHQAVTHWQCEGCGRVFQWIGEMP